MMENTANGVYEYDEIGNVISHKDNKGFEVHYKYNEKGKIISRKNNK